MNPTGPTLNLTITPPGVAAIMVSLLFGFLLIGADPFGESIAAEPITPSTAEPVGPVVPLYSSGPVLPAAPVLRVVGSTTSTTAVSTTTSTTAVVTVDGRGHRRVSEDGSAMVEVDTATGSIWVHPDLADGLRRLLADASADGFDFDGWGWRSHQRQIELRAAHCGNSDYGIWRKPSHRCSPPTARPGRSRHEQGLAIDFTYRGSVIKPKSAAFEWLAANGSKYGLKNLPSEAWHWSDNGH